MNLITTTISALSAKLSPHIPIATAAVDLAAPLPPPESFLVAAELAALEKFTTIKRRKQWLGGRLAAKTALLRKDGGGLTDWEIVNEKDGRPGAIFIPDPGRAAPISISHSHNLACALVADHPCGIDVELISGRPRRLAPRFSAPTENEIIKDLDPEPGCTLLWCAKESLRKGVRPMPGFFDLELIKLEPGTNGYIMEFKIRGEIIHRCAAAIINNYGFSFCLPPSDF